MQGGARLAGGDHPPGRCVQKPSAQWGDWAEAELCGTPGGSTAGLAGQARSCCENGAEQDVTEAPAQAGACCRRGKKGVILPRQAEWYSPPTESNTPQSQSLLPWSERP